MDRLKNILSTLKHLDLDGEIEKRRAVRPRLGGTCEVFVAWSKKHEKEVAVKRIRLFLREDEKFAKKFAKEIRIWASLKHERVLPLLGYFVEGEDAMPSLVSLWMVNGTVDDYMKDFPRGGEETRAMLSGIAQGLCYLHSRDVIHADLKSCNILISDDHKPLLADFGLSSALTFTKSITTTSTTGTVRFMAVELFDTEPPVHTSATDVWAFGMVALELLSGDIPYGNKSEARVPSLILEGKLPDMPQNSEKFAQFYSLWEMCEYCWNKTPEERPTAARLCDVLTQMANLSTDSATTQDGGQPIDGRNYYLMNLGHSLWLDLASSDPTEGNIIIVYPKNSPSTPNQIWHFSGSFAEFTLQNLHALRAKGVKGGGSEGHLRIEHENAVVGREPFKWKLQSVGNDVYKFLPVNRPETYLAIISRQAELVPENEDDNQKWTFVEVPVTPFGSVNPMHGRNYYIVNVWLDRWLDLADNDPTEGQFVIGWSKRSPPSTTQIWTFCGSLSEFTIQNLLALNMKGVIGGGSEGHLRIESDRRNGKTIIGREPFKWKLESFGNNLYKFHPVNYPDLSLTSVFDETSGVSGYAPQLEPTRAKDDTQHFAFIPAAEFN